MTTYVCQIPHRLPAKVWAADSDQDVIDAIAGDLDIAFESALDAAEYDMRAAYVTHDPLDLYHWSRVDPAALATGASGAVLTNHTVRSDIEALASREDDPDDEDAAVYRALDGRFVWSDAREEWRLDNQEPQEQADLALALCEAAFTLALHERLEQI